MGVPSARLQAIRRELDAPAINGRQRALASDLDPGRCQKLRQLSDHGAVQFARMFGKIGPVGEVRMQEPAVVALITALPPRQAMFDEPAPVLALRKPFDLRSGQFEWPGSLRWPQPQAGRTHFCIDMVGEPAARLLVDFRQPLPGKLGG